MTQLTYLSRRRGRYYFRCRVPTDLVPKLGRRELFRSLRTADPRIARQRWHRVTIVTAELWNAVRKAMTQEEIDRHVARWLSDQLQADQLQRVETEFAEEYATFCGITPYAAAADLIGSEAEANLEEWRKAVKRHDWERAAHLADRLIREQGLDVSRDSPEYALLCMRLTVARGELEGIRAARSLGDWTDLPPTRTVEQAEPATSPTKSPALGKLIDEYLTEKRTRGDTAPKRLLDFNAALTLFRQWCGDDTPIASIDAVKIGQFRSLLAKLPSNHTKRFPDLTLEQIVEEAEKRGLPPRDASTVNQKYLALLEAFFEWAKRGALIGSNPAVGIRAEVSRSR